MRRVSCIHAELSALCAATALALVSAPPGSASFTHATGSPVATGGFQPFSIAIGDLNGDADLDLVTANASSNDVSILLGNGIGGFSAAAGSPVATGGSASESLAIGRLNGDTNPDLAVVNRNSTNISVLLGNGAGGFSAAPGSPVAAGGLSPRSVAIGNLDPSPPILPCPPPGPCTSTLDLAVANSGSDDVSILLGDGAGGFSPAGGSPVATGGDFPQSVAIGNLNADANPDLALANDGTSNNVSALLGNGAGGFSAAPGSPVAAGGDNPISVAIGDLNSDANADLAVANNLTNDVSVLLGNGAGGFSPAADSPVATGGSFARSVAIADLNADANADLAVASSGSNNVSILLGNGAGGFSPAPGTPVATGGSGSISVVIGNINGDANPDLAVANNGLNNVSVLLNAAAIATGSPSSLAFASQAQGTLSAAQTITVSNTGLGDPLQVSRVRAIGPHPSDFLVSRDTCSGESVAMSSTCEIDVRFAPSAIGAHAATLQIRYPNSAHSPATVALSGTGGSLPQGAQGPAGPQGPPGRDATVSCRGKKKKKPKCTIVFTASASAGRATARLSRGATTYARGSAYVGDGQAKVPLIAQRRMAPDRYLLTLKVREGAGKPVVTRRKVTVR